MSFFLRCSRVVLLVGCVLILFNPADGQTTAPAEKKSTADYSGTYTFLRDGEFIQVNLEANGKVTGYVSRYGNSESDSGVFLDHFFKQAKLDGNQFSFATETVHAISYEFRGTVERGPGKNPGDEAYYVLKGTLTESSMDEAKKVASRSMEVTFKIFPRDLGAGPDQK